MKRILLIPIFFTVLTNIINAQGQNRTFGKFKKQKGEMELSCTDNCATLILVDEKGECDNSEFICLTSTYSNWENYQIKLNKDISNLMYNLTDVPYTNKMFAYQINYLTYECNFEAGKTYYFKTIKLAKGLSLSCGPLVTETTKDDFEAIIKGKNIKSKGDGIIYLNPEKK